MPVPKTFRFVPEFLPTTGEWEKQQEIETLKLLRQAVDLFLRAEEWQPAESDSNPSLLVLIPRNNDQVTVGDARWLSDNASQQRARVLICDAYDHFAPLPEGIASWLYIAHEAGFDPASLRNQLIEWANEEEQLETIDDHGSELVDNLKQGILDNSVRSSTDGAGFDRFLDQSFTKDAIDQETTSYLKSGSPLDFYYGLILLGGVYSRIEHDLNRYTYELIHKNDNEESLKKLGRLRRIRQFVDACRDTLMALRHPVPKPADSKRNVILLIDDRPELVANELNKIIKTFLTDYQFWTCKPSYEQGSELTLWDIAGYNSLRFKADPSELMLKIHKNPDGESEKIRLREVREQCAYFLVDILFEIPGGGEAELGNRMINGLHRMMRDIASADEAIPPTIIAISRADDLEKIQACLLAGADGYLLKSRLLSLPSVLGRLRHPIRESVGALHRNFRSLYSLPGEVIGLLKTTIIEGIDFRKGIPSKSPSKHQEALAKLLKAIPKLDVHVHVGSLMTPEFLTIASIVMLVRHQPGSQPQQDIWDAIKLFCNFWRGESEVKLYLHRDLCFLEPNKPYPLEYKHGKDGVEKLAKKVKDLLIEEIQRFQNEDWEDDSEIRYYKFRSILHKALGVRDYWTEDKVIKKIQQTPNLALFFFAHAYCVTEPTEYRWVFKHNPDKKLEEVRRMYILFLAAQNRANENEPKQNEDNKLQLKEWDLLAWFRQPSQSGGNRGLGKPPSWKNLFDYFYGKDVNGKDANLSPKKLRESNWKTPKVLYEERVTASLRKKPDSVYLSPLSESLPTFNESPIEWLLATGTRCKDLTTYLEGCELSGAEHLRHPYLIYLYAQHVVYQFAQLGVFYAELRAAITGYESKEFSFKDACDCFVQAFTDAQEAVYWKYRPSTDSQDNQPIWLWKEPFNLDNLFPAPSAPWAANFPVKVGVILTGKRHKPMGEMLREIAGAVVQHTRPDSSLKTAREFVQEQISKCRLVGFDLAGQEEEHPPERFRAEFEQLARLHVPITAHAGENAHAGYVESAVLDLRARRLGHGLALPEDPLLMARVREDRVCVELCPVSNFQTSRFGPAGENGHAHGHEREYPLRRLLENGNAVCINTDNPVISYTNIIKEYFQASYAYGEPGLSLWELLRIIRMGFVHSFMNMPERRAILELVDQILFDLFSNQDVIALLRELARTNSDRGGAQLPTLSAL